jgi:hypothetical protein
MASTPPTAPETELNAATGGVVSAAGALAGPQTCIICAKDAPVQCSTCRVAYYCSAECQATDKFAHDHLCRRDLYINQPRGRRFVRAILFAHGPENPTPRFVYVSGSNEIQRLVAERTETKLIDFNSVRNRAILSPILGIFQHRSLSDIGLYNQVSCIIHGSKWWDNIAFDVNE